jgi:hypothetical protein
MASQTTLGRLLATLIISTMLVACHEGGEASDGGRDSGLSTEGGAAVVCCEIDERPTCDCRQTGGTRQANGVCPADCDAVPGVVRRFVDENGCPAIELSKMSCLDPIGDASPGN